MANKWLHPKDRPNNGIYYYEDYTDDTDDGFRCKCWGYDKETRCWNTATNEMKLCTRCSGTEGACGRT